ncbi:MAG TPA: glycosyltransferase family 2 protein [Patescibacteria group bacterium]|nr:glycosyltransferase family 2 protein [Patescibacteria group bacterium]
MEMKSRGDCIVSIIIVHYKADKYFFACLDSIYKNKPKVSFEIIVVDNDEQDTIEQKLKEKFPTIVYVKNTVNNGWGGGTNLGVKFAKGKYLYFLNPDTIVLRDALDNNYKFIQQNPKAGVVASLLLDAKRKVYQLQGTKTLTPFRAVIVYSFLNKWFSNNPVSSSFFYKNIKRDKPFIIETPILSASIIKKNIFEKIGMFDENYFLYFEENDLGKRVEKYGYINYINPNSKIVHVWEASTSTRNDINEIFRASRKYYFQKYYGGFTAWFVDNCIMLPIFIKNIFYGRI